MATEMDETSVKRSNSRTRTPRPTTPLRPSSRSSFRDSARSVHDGEVVFPLNRFEPAFAELSDAVADLEANMMHFQIMHESLARFSESFASFLYGLNMNAFCVDFPEVSYLNDNNIEIIFCYVLDISLKCILTIYRHQFQSLSGGIVRDNQIPLIYRMNLTVK